MTSRARRVGGIDVDAALVLGARGGQRRQVILELLLELGIGEAQAGGRAQIQRAQFAVIEQQGQLLALGLLVGALQPGGR